jgi:hypothetical protein
MMKKIFSILTLLIITTSCFLLATCNINKKKVLLIPREGSENLELALTKESGVMIKMLKDSGYDVIVATASGKPLITKTLTLKPDMKLSDVKVTDYVGIIMPCMNAGSYTSTESISIVKQAASLGIPIAAQRGSVLILNKAGVRSFGLHDPIYGSPGVSQNGMILTSDTCPYYALESGNPDGTVELTQKFINLLETKKN